MAKAVKTTDKVEKTYTIETFGSIQIGQKVIRPGVPTEITDEEMEIIMVNNFAHKIISIK